MSALVFKFYYLLVIKSAKKHNYLFIKDLQVIHSTLLFNFEQPIVHQIHELAPIDTGDWKFIIS